MYSSQVSKVSDDGVQTVSGGIGTFEVANFALKAGLKEISGEAGQFRVEFLEIDSQGQNSRTIASLTSEADVVSFVTKKKVAAERKALQDKEPKADFDPATDSE